MEAGSEEPREEDSYNPWKMLGATEDTGYVRRP